MMLLLQNELGLEVIYGDTDSVMVNTRTKDLAQAKEQVYILQTCQHVLYNNDITMQTLRLAHKIAHIAVA
jgi:thiamine pyrophosphokinase